MSSDGQVLPQLGRTFVWGSLGGTGLEVSRLCFGTLTLGPLQANLPLDQGISLIRAALERGVNFFDTAQLYQTYAPLAGALQGWSGPVVVASKSYDYTKEGMEASLEQALRSLGRERVEVFLLHEQESEWTIKGHWPAMEALIRAREKGLVGAVGISTHHVAGVRAAVEIPEIQVIHPLLNRRGLGIADGGVEEMSQAIQVAYEKGLGIYAMKPLGGGNLLSEARESLRWIGEKPWIHSVAVGIQSPQELEFNLAILSGEEPSQNLSEAVERAPRRLHIESWCQGCGTCLEKCRAGALKVDQGKAVVNREVCRLCGYCGAVCPGFAIKVI